MQQVGFSAPTKENLLLCRITAANCQILGGNPLLIEERRKEEGLPSNLQLFNQQFLHEENSQLVAEKLISHDCTNDHEAYSPLFS